MESVWIAEIPYRRRSLKLTVLCLSRICESQVRRLFRVRSMKDLTRKMLSCDGIRDTCQ